MRFSRRQELLAAFLLGLLAIGIFNLHYRSPILTTGSDARFSLYVTQALLSTGSIQLDSPLEALGPNIRQDYRIEEIGEHLYYYFPLGSSLFSLPFVWAANQAGYLVDSTQHEDRLQNLIAAILSALIFLVTFAVFRCYGGLWWSTLAATVAMLGSSFSSTLGTGLWTLNFATLFVMLSIWLLVRRDSAHSTTVHPLWLGSFLFAAYLARPTTAVFILLVFVYLIWQDKREVWVTAVTALAWLFLFVLYSRAEMGVWLPPYYLPQRLAGANVPLPIVFYGLFFSPGRGLFVFSPMFLLLLIVALWRWRHLRHEPLFWFALAWMGLHTWTLLRFEHWWGGASFGPRLLTDIVPAFIILTAVLRKRWPLGLGLPARRWLLGLGIVTAVFSIYVNAYAGLYVPATSLWNSMPDIDKAPQYLFDWRHPQFAATQTANCARVTDFHLQRLASHETVLAPYQPGFALPWANAAPEGTYKRDPQWYLPAARRRAAVTITNPPGSFKIFLPVLANGAQQLGLLVGWDLSQPAGVTAVCQPAFLALRLTALEPDVPYTLHLTARSAAQQPIVIEFNGDVIDTIQPQPAYQEWHIPLAGRPFHPDSYDLFTFTTPAGAPPDLTLQAVTVSPADKADP